MHETSAWGWRTGKTQRDGVGKEVGGGIGMGNTCHNIVNQLHPKTKLKVKENFKNEKGVHYNFFSFLSIFPITDGPTKGRDFVSIISCDSHN